MRSSDIIESPKRIHGGSSWDKNFLFMHVCTPVYVRVRT